MNYKVVGNNRLCGSVKVQGAKNSILPILSACVMCRGEVLLHNCPDISDVNSALKILNHLGIKTKKEKTDLFISCNGVSECEIPKELMHEMRSSVVFLGPLVATTGKAKIYMPGGCEIGPRPIDIHIDSLKKMGVDTFDKDGVLCFEAKKKLHGTQIMLVFPSVGATENIMLAAALSNGKTTIINAAKEPEIIDLARFLTRCGAKISGAGSSSIEIEGTASLSGCEYEIMPDRIATVTYLASAAMTGGDVTVLNADFDSIRSSLDLFERSGCKTEIKKDSVRVAAPKRLSSPKLVKTMPHPGFATDAQALLMAMATVSSGSTMFVETIFESRYRHACELVKMGADIKIEGKVAVVSGVDALHCADVECTDLRGGAAVVIASLSADGESRIYGIEHIDRGYERFETNLLNLGANIIREK